MDILLIVKEKSHSLFASVSISDMSLYYRYILVDVMYTSEILTQTFVKFLTNHSIIHNMCRVIFVVFSTFSMCAPALHRCGLSPLFHVFVHPLPHETVGCPAINKLLSVCHSITDYRYSRNYLIH